jgi:hypothetical protein
MTDGCPSEGMYLISVKWHRSGRNANPNSHQTGWRYPVGYHREDGGGSNYHRTPKMFEHTIFNLRNAA